MHPKETSVTTSSRFVTGNQNSAAPPLAAQPKQIQFVKGVGPKLALVLQKRGIETTEDLIRFFPRTYEDRSSFSLVKNIQAGEKASLELEILGTRRIRLRNRRNSILEVRAKDNEGTPIRLKWFRAFQGLEKQFPVGKKIWEDSKSTTNELDCVQGIFAIN